MHRARREGQPVLALPVSRPYLPWTPSKTPDRLFAAGTGAARRRPRRPLSHRARARCRRHGDRVSRPGLRHNRRVAVKVLRPELAAVIGAERFLTEITTTANLQHPH